VKTEENRCKQGRNSTIINKIR